ncbi:MAG: DegT/DnrJ/EryC1/StrS family aminotransferase [Hyphomicrobiales bacterium]
MKNKIWLSSPHMSGNETKYIDLAFKHNHVFPLGPNVEGLESDIIDFTGSKACTCLSSGTSAIHLALIMLGIKEGDEVICSSFTFSASANPILYLKAIPVFVDSEKETWNMSPELLEIAIKDRIKNGKKPKAIILVHLYGMPADLDKIIDLAKRFDIPIIEDAAEALGSKYVGKCLGTFGDIGIFSFNGNKIITTSGGGALVSNNKEYCERALYLSTQARQSFPYYHHVDVGYNYRMSNISAGIGRGQMEVLENRVNKRRAIHKFYFDHFADSPTISFLQEPNDKFYSNFWLTTIIIENKDIEKIRIQLEEKNIESRYLWKPMHLQPVFKDFPSYQNGVSESLFKRGLCLPSSSNITDDELNCVVEELKNLI